MPSHYCPSCDAITSNLAGSCASCSAEQPTEGWPEDRLIGLRFLDTYSIIKRLGSGGFGVVYLAENAELGGRRAIKILDSRHVHDDAILRRFKREAKALYRLQSPYTVRMERWGRSQDGHHYLVMEFAKGQTLRQVLKKEGPLDEQRALMVARQVGIALADAHSVNIVHRDLKPSNIVLRQHKHLGERVAVLDFGIAKILSDQTSSRRSGLVGTPIYMAPELWNPVLGEANIRADLWSLGVVLYEMLSGDLPFNTEGVSDVMSIAYQVANLEGQQLLDQLERLSVDPETTALLERLLHRDPKARFQNPGEMVDAIDEHSALMNSDGGAQVTPRKLSRRRDSTRHDELAATVNVGLSEPGPPQTEAFGFDIDMTIERGDFLPTPTPLTASGKEPRKKPSWRPIFIALLLVGVIAGVMSFADKLFPTGGSSQADERDAQSDDAGLAEALIVEQAPTQSYGDGMTGVLLPSGVFEMGDSDAGEADQSPHPVHLDSFYLDATEVTAEMWERCVNQGPCTPESERQLCLSAGQVGAELAACVTWYDATQYCDFAGRRLPTEAEWEHAARAGNGDVRPIWYDRLIAGGEPPTPNEDVSGLGIMGLGWGVREWVSDWYSATYYPVSPVGNPVGSLFGRERVVRGGPFEETPVSWVARDKQDPRRRFPDLGFRCARGTGPN